jgi:hypothetical protein
MKSLKRLCISLHNLLHSLICPNVKKWIVANYCNKNSLYTVYLPFTPPLLSCADTSCLHPQVYATPQRLHTVSGRTIYPSADLNVVSVPCTCAQVLYFIPYQVYMCVRMCVVCISHPIMYLCMNVCCTYIFCTLSMCVHMYIVRMYFVPYQCVYVCTYCICCTYVFCTLSCLYVYVLYLYAGVPPLSVYTCVMICLFAELVYCFLWLLLLMITCIIFTYEICNLECLSYCYICFL